MTTNKTKRIKQKSLKKNNLRYAEYYQMQHIFDNLYEQSLAKSKFKHLYDLITNDKNILLAYRTIKNNKGSHTPGTNKHTIEFWQEKSTEDFLKYMKARFENYQPQKVRRVEIKKPNGKMRPLGIPCIEDRIIQQSIKQVLEPICEAKFHPDSFGFRPNRSTKHAVAYLMRKVNKDKYYFMVDIDIKGFFDNVDHGKLLKQLWTLGIQDKKLFCILSKMLKAEVEGYGISQVGVPQGGILSPLLANVVLNELDWWLSNQWQTFPTKKTWNCSGHKYRHLQRSKLKEFYLVRYADDFKICCKNYQTANKIFQATQQWLKERLKLEISPEKSGITDIRKQATEFLGLKLIARQKKHKWIIFSYLTSKAEEHVLAKIKAQLNRMKQYPNANEVIRYNAIVRNVQEYYSMATHVSNCFNKINFRLMKRIELQLKQNGTDKGFQTADFIKRYKSCKAKIRYLYNIALYPIHYVQTKPPHLFTQSICNYTIEGRKKIHKEVGYINTHILDYITTHPIKKKSIEYNDNRLSLYIGQMGKCAITGLPLEINMEVHHKKPISQGGTDAYKNLMLILYEVHKLIHVTDLNLIQYYLSVVNPTKKALAKINQYREQVGNKKIDSLK